MVLKETLETLQGRFILSINDRTEVRELFSRFALEAVTVLYMVGGEARQRSFGELIITN